MVWTQEYQLFVLCDHAGEGSETDVLTTWVVVIFKVRSSSDDGIYASDRGFDWPVWSWVNWSIKTTGEIPLLFSRSAVGSSNSPVLG